MRVAVVTPYDWSLPGGVNRHIEGLAAELRSRGHDVRVFAPASDTDGLPDWLTPLGGTFPFSFNNAKSNCTLSPAATAAIRRGLREGDFDVVHIHEPVAPIGPHRAVGLADLPTVGTFHTFSEHTLPHALAAVVGSRRMLNRLHGRIAVSEPAAWTGRRFFGGRYRIIPNGVDLHSDPASVAAPEPGEPLRIVFVGQPVERKGLPLLLRAFEALREHVPAELTIVGAEASELEALLVDPSGVTALGRPDDATKRAVLERSHVLCAPSLGAESFGMVLTEAFAAGTPVVASDIAGYRGVVTDGVDGVLVPRGDAAALAAALRDLAADPERLARLSAGARASAERYAWPVVADQVLEVYEDAIAVATPQTLPVRLGLRPADGRPRVRPQRLPPLDPRPPLSRRAFAAARRVALVAAILAVVAGAFLGVQRLGWDAIAASVVKSSPAWVLIALGLMTASMLLRAIAWYATLRAAPPTAHARLQDAAQGTAIGVLMSATLPARLGELSRALIVARRLGRPRESLAPVLGTMVSQTAINVLALVLLGTVVVSGTDLFAHRHATLFIYAIAPLVIVAVVVGAPALVGAGTRSARLAAFARAARAALVRVRSGLAVFRRPGLGSLAVGSQLGAWALQWAACAALLEALEIDGPTRFAAAAAVLFAVNVTAVLPVTPSNLGVFQAACVAVLTSGFHVHAADALAYGIILQAVELATAVVVGAPALLREGVTWREVRLRALHHAPIELGPASPATSAAE